MEKEQLLCRLLQTMLRSALLGVPYPGQAAQTSFFPDVETMTDREEIVVARRHLGDACSVTIPGFTIVVCTEEEIAARASAQGDFPYFRLTEVKIDPGRVALSLELAWAVSEASKQAGQHYLGGGGVHVVFERTEGEWQAPAGPAATWMS